MAVDSHDVDSNVAADRHLGVGGLQPDSNPAEDKPVGKAAAEDKLVGKAAVEERVVAEDTAVEDTVVDMAVEDKAAENSLCFPSHSQSLGLVLQHQDMGEGPVIVAEAVAGWKSDVVGFQKLVVVVFCKWHPSIHAVLPRNCTKTSESLPSWMASVGFQS